MVINCKTVHKTNWRKSCRISAATVFCKPAVTFL